MLLRSSSGCDFLVVGLGNPGSKYWNTRHNVGYAALDALAKDLGVTADRVKFQGLTGQASLNGKKLILLKPTTYMNLSGQSVQAAAKFYKVPPEHILVLSRYFTELLMMLLITRFICSASAITITSSST